MAKKAKIPKRVVGVKVPRAIRRSAILRSLLANDAGRQVLGEALLAGATAAAGILAAGNASGLRRGTAKVGKIAVEAVSSATGAMADVIGSAAREALHTSKKHKPRPDRPITH